MSDTNKGNRKSFKQSIPRFVLGLFLLLFGILCFTNADYVSSFFLYVFVYLFGVFFFVPGVILIGLGAYFIFTSFTGYRYLGMRKDKQFIKRKSNILDLSMVLVILFSIAILISCGINNVTTSSGEMNLYVTNCTQFYNDANHMQTIAPLSDSGNVTFYVSNLRNLSNVGGGIIPVFIVALGNQIGLNVIGTTVIFSLLMVLSICTLLRHPVIAIYRTIAKIKIERKSLKSKAPDYVANDSTLREKEDINPDEIVSENEGTIPTSSPKRNTYESNEVKNNEQGYLKDINDAPIYSSIVESNDDKSIQINEEAEAIDNNFYEVTDEEEENGLEEVQTNKQVIKEEIKQEPIHELKEEVKASSIKQNYSFIQEEPKEDKIEKEEPKGAFSQNNETNDTINDDVIHNSHYQGLIKEVEDDEKEEDTYQAFSNSSNFSNVIANDGSNDLSNDDELEDYEEYEINEQVSEEQQDADDELERALQDRASAKKNNEVVFNEEESIQEVDDEEFDTNDDMQIENNETEEIDNQDTSENEGIELQLANSPTLNYVKPPLKLLVSYDNSAVNEKLAQDADLESVKIGNFFRVSEIDAKVVGYTIGASTTRFHVRLAPGASMNSISSKLDNLSVALNGNHSVRFVPVIEGHDYSGIEVGNQETMVVPYRDCYLELMEKDRNVKEPCLFPLGKDISGDIMTFNLCKLPHMLVAGSTGSGKTVFIHSLIVSMIMRATPNQVKFILIDPKRVEFTFYSDMPHLYCPIIDEPKKAIEALRLLVSEMERRYELLRSVKVNSYDDYMKWASGKKNAEKFPRIVCIIDEFADLMTTAKEAEIYVARLAAMARACGIHLVVATQRPSTKVITGDIKNNIPGRIALLVSSQIDSRVILDETGAESLLGRGDLLARIPGKKALIRAQSPYVSDEEIKEVVEYLKARIKPVYDKKFLTLDATDASDDTQGEEGRKNIVAKAKELPFYETIKNEVIATGRVSIGYLCKKFGISFDNAELIVDALEIEGFIVTVNNGKKVVR